MRVFFTVSFGLKLAFFCLLVGMAAGLALGSPDRATADRVAAPSPVSRHLTGLEHPNEGRWPWKLIPG
jgi:hypothetical protein